MDDKCACDCGATLGPAAISDYFATEGCQRRWNRRQAGLPVREPDPLDAVLDAIQAAAARRRQREQEAPAWPPGWRQVGYTTSGAVYTAPPPQVARWWSYNDTLHCWHLMEADGYGSRRLYAVTDIVAREIPDRIEEHLRRRFDGHIPPLPTRYID